MIATPERRYRLDLRPFPDAFASIERLRLVDFEVAADLDQRRHAAGDPSAESV
jgi:hypothetical protein